MLNENSNIRRIDELGRIVIPKDIRKKLHIKNNEPLEIYISSKEIKIKKYSVFNNSIEYIKNLIDIATRITGNQYLVTDREKVIVSTEKEYENENMEEYIDKYLNMGHEIKNEKIVLRLLNDKSLVTNAHIEPLLIDDEKSGIIIEYNNDKLNSNEIIKLLGQLIKKELSTY